MRRNYNNEYIIYLSLILLFFSVYLYISKEIKLEDNINNINVEFINTNNIAVSEVNYKNSIDNNVKIIEINNNSNNISNNNGNRIEKQPIKDNNININIPKKEWKLPTKTGYITNYESYNHVAIDITSPRGIYETIYPVYDGIISSIYYDLAGAKIVTVKHNVDGTIYTSQYVHLSSYAPNIYVGKPVTINDPLGQMGMTGIATGVHLHLTVADCSLYEDNNCKDLNSFFRYINRRYKEGFKGLRSLRYVPNRW